ncbi:MAG: lipase, partial [Saprospiraceae bacterium]|nr:lipase [Saprospiraceae bacterium]
VIILGHSQGGAIAFLLTSHLYSLQRQNLLPGDIRFKTYCSAGPKPGNLYYAYDYEARTHGGWAFNVVNSADWVPETPFSIRTLQDFNNTNPFVNAKEVIKKQKFPNRVVLKYVYKKLSKPTEKSRRNYEKYLGDKAGKMVQKQLPGYEPPPYAPTNHFVRTGHTIVLLADAAYYLKYPDSETKIFAHHLHMPYLYLTERMLDTAPAMETKK